MSLSIRQFAKLLADQTWLRRYRARRAGAGPLRIRLAFVRNEIRKLTHREWKPSYILPGGDADYLTYVPAPVDVMAGYKLLKPSAPPLLLKTLLSGGDTFIDVGANIGDWTLPAAKLVGPAGRVLAFEPVPRMAEALRKSAWANRFDQVRVFDVALSNHAGEADFSVEKENSGGSRLGRMPDDPKRTFSGLRVKVATLDDVVGAEALKAVALIKIDVEGFEAEVLQVATRTLADLRPALYFETGHEPPEKRRIIGDLLAGSGYELVGIVCAEGVVEAAIEDYVSGGGCSKASALLIFSRCPQRLEIEKHVARGFTAADPVAALLQPVEQCEVPLAVQLPGDVPGLLQQLGFHALKDCALVPLGVDLQDVDRAHAKFSQTHAAAADSDALSGLAALLAALIERPAALVSRAGRGDQIELRVGAAKALVMTLGQCVAREVLRQEREILRHRLKTQQARRWVARPPEQRRGAHVRADIDDSADFVLRRQIFREIGRLAPPQHAFVEDEGVAGAMPVAVRVPVDRDRAAAGFAPRVRKRRRKSGTARAQQCLEPRLSGTHRSFTHEIGGPGVEAICA